MKIVYWTIAIVVALPIIGFLANAFLMPGWKRGRDGGMYYSEEPLEEMPEVERTSQQVDYSRDPH